MASSSSRPLGKLVTSREPRIILQVYNYFKKEEEAGGPRLKINTVLKKRPSEATGYSFNVIRAVRQGELKTPKKNVNRKQIKFDKLDSFDFWVIKRLIHNRLYLKNEFPTLKKIHEILVEHMDFPYKEKTYACF